MFSLISQHKKLIIGIIAVILIFIGYGVFIAGDNTDNITDALTVDTSSSGGDTAAAAASNAVGKQFVSQLLAIQNIHFNIDFFSDPAYSYLQDTSRELTPQDAGRDNPFAPVEKTGNESSATGRNPAFVITSEEATTTPPASSASKKAPTTGGTTSR